MIHPSTIIDKPGSVQIAEDVEIGPLCYIRGPVIIGRGTRIGPHVIIGTDGEHRTARSMGYILIGEDVEIRELTVIQRGTGDRDTTIRDRVLVMDHGHIAHDVVLDEDVTLSPNVTLGGHTRVHRGATIGIGAITHQHTTVGAYSMIGMGSIITKDIPPFALVAGNPAKYLRDNTHGRERATSGEWRAHFIADSRRKILDTL